MLKRWRAFWEGFKRGRTDVEIVFKPSPEIRDILARALAAAAERARLEQARLDRLRAEWKQAQEAEQEQVLADMLRRSTAMARSSRGEVEWRN